MSRANKQDGGRSQAVEFDSTHWSVVLEARGSAPDCHLALETLCRTYWFPLYAYVRRRGHSVHEAQDLTQEFFARLLERHAVDSADPNRGRFRAFLLVSLRNFLANEWDHRQTAKRGGGQRPHSFDLDFYSGDSRYSSEPSHELTPELLYEKQWAITLLDHVLTQLRDELERAGKAREFSLLKPFLAGRNTTATYAQVGQALGTSESAAMSAASRLRKRYRALLRAEIAQTLADPSDVDEELQTLFGVLGS